MTLQEFNLLSKPQAFEHLYACCHCRRWAECVAEQRPFRSFQHLMEEAEDQWLSANEAEILEAFGGHARIGDMELLRSRYAGRAAKEQGQVAAATEAVLQELNALNIEYQQRHGFIFIVCATGKSAEEMLAILKSRIDNSRAEELATGAREQGAITRLRLQELFVTGN